MISTQNLSYTYPNSEPISFPDLDLKQNDALLVLGKSGKGKTTFLHLIGGLLRSKKGAIEIADTNICNLSSKKLDKFRGENIGIVFQKPHFAKALTIKENLLLAQKLAGFKLNTQRVQSLLNELNIGDKGNKFAHELSVGEQQRASIARAVVNKPALLLADEPTSALDDMNTQVVSDLLKNTSSENSSTLIIVTHDNRLKTEFPNTIDL